MLGRAAFSFSICVNHGLEIKNSGFPSASAIVLLKRATSRVLMPSRVRISFSLAPGSTSSPLVQKDLMPTMQNGMANCLVARHRRNRRSKRRILMIVAASQAAKNPVIVTARLSLTYRTRVLLRSDFQTNHPIAAVSMRNHDTTMSACPIDRFERLDMLHLAPYSYRPKMVVIASSRNACKKNPTSRRFQAGEYVAR